MCNRPQHVEQEPTGGIRGINLLISHVELDLLAPQFLGNVTQSRVVVTRDADFVNSFMTSRQPEKLLLISTGNVTDTGFEVRILPYLPAIVTALATHDFVEVTRTALIVHT